MTDDLKEIIAEAEKSGDPKAFFKERLREASTWRGIIGLLTLAGVALSPDQIELIAGIGAVAYMLFETLMPDKKGEK